MADVVDAEFEMVDPRISEPGPKSPSNASVQPPRADLKAKAQLGVFDARRQKSGQKPLSQTKLIGVGSVACIAVFLASGGYALFTQGTHDQAATQDQPNWRSIGSGASEHVTSTHGLRLSDVRFANKTVRGKTVLTVDGMIANATDSNQSVPALRLVLGAPSSRAYYQIARGETLAPGEHLVFTSHVPLRNTIPIRPEIGFDH